MPTLERVPGPLPDDGGGDFVEPNTFPARRASDLGSLQLAAQPAGKKGLVLKNLKRFVREDEGATMVEYGLMVALIAVVCIVTVTFLGTQIGQTFRDTGVAVDGAQGAPQVAAGADANP